MLLECRVTCPRCGERRQAVMPAGYAEHEYACPACGVKSAAKKGEHCVFCSYGDVMCPDMQGKRDCCSG